MSKSLFKEVIADANDLKNVAITTAKLAMENALTPKLQSLLANKLSEELDETYEEEEIDEKKDTELDDVADDEKHPEKNDGEGECADENFDIDAILAEIEGGEDDEEEVDVNEKKDKELDDIDDKEDVDKEEKEGDGEETDESIDLNALLEEDEEDLDADQADINAADNELDEAEKPEDILAKLKTLGADALAKLSDYIKKELSPASVKPGGKYDGKAATLSSNIKEKKDEESDEDVEEKSKEIEELKSTLKEVNRSNAKLMLLSKVLYNHSLTKEGKEHVVKQLDKAQTVKETKLVYSTLTEGFKKAKTGGKSTIKESRGSASAASGASTKVIIDPMVARFQKLAGIKI